MCTDSPARPLAARLNVDTVEMAILLITAILLSGSLTGTATHVIHIRNFQVASNSTHITFFWDIAIDYIPSTISYFNLYYQHRTSNQSLYISYYSATYVQNENDYVFSYTYSLRNFNNGPYIMWVVGNRDHDLPRYYYSERKYVKINEMDTAVLELKVHLDQPVKTCSDFLGSDGHSAITQTSREVGWILYEICQCALEFELSVYGYFTCTTSDYIIFRTRVSTFDDSSLDLASLKTGLSKFLTNPEREARITINKVGYLVSPGPCGLTVPSLDSPHCFNDSFASESKTSMPTAQAAVSTSPQDHTAVTTIVAVMCGTMLILVLSGCIVFFTMGLWILRMSHRRINKVSHDLEMESEEQSTTNCKWT